MRHAIGRLFDNLTVLVAAVLTICGFMLLFLPWKQALAVRIVEPPPKPSGEVFVNVGPREAPVPIDKGKDARQGH
jgi:hypothetical protein